VPGSDMRKSWTEIAASYEKLAEIAERGEGQSGAEPERRFEPARVAGVRCNERRKSPATEGGASFRRGWVREGLEGSPAAPE
jgi:hypothetical protein